MSWFRSNPFSRNETLLICLLLFGWVPSGRGAVQEGPILNPANGHLYYLLSQNTWSASEQEAVGLGGHLVTINDAAEQAWVFRTFVLGFGGGHLVWLGLNDLRREGVFEWVSGEAVTTTHWAGGEPNNANGNEHYTAMYYRGHDAQGLWNDWPHIAADTIGVPVKGVVEVRPEHYQPPLDGWNRLTFEGLGVMPASGGTVPEGARLSTQYQGTFGAVFSSMQPWVAVVLPSGTEPPSPPHVIGGVNAAGRLDLSAPIEIRFTYPGYPNYPNVPASTTYVSVRTDLNGSNEPVTLMGYDLQDELIASSTVTDTGGTTLRIIAPEIHRVVLQGAVGVFFDDLTFGELKPSRVVIDFEDLAGTSFLAGSSIPPESRLSQQYAARGVVFSSGGGYAAAVALGEGHATSGRIGFGGSTANGLVSYSEPPVELGFEVWGKEGGPGVTDYVSLRADLLHNFGRDEYWLEAYDVSGALLGTARFPDSENVIAELAFPEMHRVKIYGTGTTAFDDLVFAPVTLARPRLQIYVEGGEALISWPAAFSGYVLEQNTDLTSPLGWSVIKHDLNRTAGVPLSTKAFFRLRRL